MALAFLVNFNKWWRKRQKEKRRLKLLALVRKVREEAGDYDNACLGSKARSSARAAARRRRMNLILNRCGRTQARLEHKK
jgi:hypothetical protein